jgi:hypothetical protein
MSALNVRFAPKADIRVFIELRSCPPAGAGFGARFFDFAFLADFAIFFIPFFFRAGAPRFAFLDFFATFIIPIKIMPRRHSHYYLNLIARIA